MTIEKIIKRGDEDIKNGRVSGPFETADELMGHLNALEGRMMIKEQPRDNYELIGRSFHSFNDNGNLSWQGRVESKVDEGVYLVQLYDWMDGVESNLRLVKILDMVDWYFYQDDEQMKHFQQYVLKK